MLDIELLRSDPEKVKAAIIAKRVGDPNLVDEIRALDSNWREGSPVPQDRIERTR
ncbi:hypothetical protein ACFLRO_02475 [Bacteroidota bacterium]